MTNFKKIFLFTGILGLAFLYWGGPRYLKRDLYYGFNILENYHVGHPDKQGEFEAGEIRKFYEFGDNNDFKKTLDKMYYLEANSIGLVVNGWVTSLHDTKIFFDRADGPKLAQAIRMAHRQGLRVFLRPTINLRKNSDQIWRGQILPLAENGQNDWDTWFRSYFDFISHYCKIATENRADGFFVGVELISTMGHLNEWNRMLTRLKQEQRYRGKWLYQSNSFFQAKALFDKKMPAEIWQLFSRIKEGDPEALLFLNQIDYLGLSFYQNYSDSGENYSLEKVQQVMDHYARILDRKINKVNTQFFKIHPGKKIEILVTEFGIKSEVGALHFPWRFAQPGGRVDERAQVAGYQAFFKTFPKYRWFKGALFWNMHVDPYYGIRGFPGRTDEHNGATDFTINGKLVEQVIESYFANWSGRWLSLRNIHTALYGLYVLAALIVILFGFHRILLTLLAGRKIPQTYLGALPQSLPKVTVQIPLYNEAEVAERILKAAARLDYPTALLEIQMLDDSTDSTPQLVAQAMRTIDPALTIRHIRRLTREGFKAGALANGLRCAEGEYIVILDADFIPTEDFLKRALPFFQDPKVGLVQAVWGYINPRHSMLTRAQELYLDGHFQIEHRARAMTGRYFNFNGTAGVFRKTCIEDAGGWELDTLTEDLDLSYRAQMRGWKFRFCPEISMPSELPDSMLLYKAQQFRWTKGSVQVFRKLIRRVFRSAAPLKAKLEAVFHLGCNIIYPCTLLMALTLYPMLNIRLRYFWNHVILVDLPLFLFGTGALIIFYGSARSRLHKPLSEMVCLIPVALMLGVGLSVSNTKAFFEGAFRIPSGFVRTPKTGVESSARPKTILKKKQTMIRSQVHAKPWMAMAEALAAIYLLFTLKFAIQWGMWMSTPFVAIFAAGFIYVSAGSFAEQWQNPMIFGETGPKTEGAPEKTPLQD